MIAYNYVSLVEVTLTKKIAWPKIRPKIMLFAIFLKEPQTISYIDFIYFSTIY